MPALGLSAAPVHAVEPSSREAAALAGAADGGQSHSGMPSTAGVDFGVAVASPAGAITGAEWPGKGEANERAGTSWGEASSIPKN